ncbi:MAG TPA: hypothetical protein VJ698_01625 [Noviherbaspirillum sp.]|uniref:hypothetical protein n=1 Tax=Noviherbaspirillum sp. TaxID=1926288 RepID=UPI002B487F52|nr:hypothetical protein [Noviherbaspirillum sp.]HJV84147.1 hypothetical protein [Noviherbaspirillum sp.]
MAAAPPFSARNRGPHQQIDGAFPSTARNGLLHLLLDLIEKNYVAGWCAVARELQRIARLPPVEYNESKVTSISQAKADAEVALTDLGWEKTYDFCERLHNYLACEVGYTWNDEFQVTKTKSEVQGFIAEELQRLFEEEGLAFEFSDGLVRRLGRKHTVDVTTRAQVVLGDPRLASARKHYDKALQFFRSPSKPDYENTVKEAVCAVEAAGKSLFPGAKASTLGDLAKWLSSAKEVSVPKALIQTITGIYAYRSGGDGIGHGGSSGGAATMEVAEYVLAVCASQIIYLVDISHVQEGDVPF